MKNIRITESCIVAGEHAEVGSLCEVAPVEAQILVASGRAIYASAPAVEQADATPEAETADASPRSRRRKA